LFKRRQKLWAVLIIAFFLINLVPYPPRAASAADDPPEITAITPNWGGQGGGFQIAISGRNFTAETRVQIGGRAAQVVEFLPDVGETPGRLTVVVPASNEIGWKDVLVINPDNQWDMVEGNPDSATGFQYLEGPAITSVTPNYGAAGSQIEIAGSNFTLGTDEPRVEIGGIEALPVPGETVTDSSIWVYAPAGLSGVVSVRVVIQGTGENPDLEVYLPQGFTYTAQASNPVLDDIWPVNSGSTEGGEIRELTGSDFRVAVGGVLPRVFFGGREAEVLEVSTGSITVLTPSNSAGVKNVRVENPDGQSSNTVTFTYLIPEQETTITSITPNQGSREGGTPVTLNLLNPPLDDQIFEMELTIGGIPAGQLSDGTITFDPEDRHLLYAVTPGGPPGTQDLILWLTMDDLRQEIRLNDGFTYLDPSSDPVITAVNSLLVPLRNWQPNDPAQLGPAEGPVGGGTPVIITGSDFRAPSVGEAVYVYFGSTPREAQVLDSEHIYAVAPPAPTSGAVDVTVINPDQATAVAPRAFSYRSGVLQAFYVTPDFGPVTGGTVVNIHGANFTADTVVELENYTITDADGNQQTVYEPADPQSISASRDGTVLTFTTPANSLGLKDLRLKNGYGEFSLRDAFRYDPPTFDEPLVTGLNPATGPVTGGTFFTLTGANFLTGAQVYIGDNLAGQTVVQNVYTITAVTPQNSPGNQSVRVVNPDGKEWPGLDTPPEEYLNFFYYSSPRITSVTPDEGSTGGGGVITMRGEQFYPGARVILGGVTETVYLEVPQEQVYVVGETEINFRLPMVDPAAAGSSVSLRVVNLDGGAAIREKALTFKDPAAEPQLTQVAPAFGPAGTTILLSGSGFAPGATVYVGWQEAGKVEVLDSGRIQAAVPQLSPGAYPVTVVNPDAGAAVLQDAFTCVAPVTSPAINAVYPDRGPREGGTPVTIAGRDFWEGALVYFGGVGPVEAEFIDSQTLKVESPAGTGLGPADIVVVNTDGGTARLAGGFTYLNPAPANLPQIAAINPSRGTTAGGTGVIITGQNFWQGAEVLLDGRPPAAVERLDQETIRLITASHPQGQVDVLIFNQDGGYALAENGFSYLEPGSSPVITAVEPGVGRAGQPNQVTILGSDFRPGAKVFFGQAEAQIITEQGEEHLFYDRIEVLTPAGEIGPVRVTVENEDLGTAVWDQEFQFLASVPRLLSLAPERGGLQGGYPVVLQAEDLEPGVKVFFGNFTQGEAIEAQILAGPQEFSLTVSAPSYPRPGTVDVWVVNPDGQSSVLEESFTYQNAESRPEITGLTPAAGPSEGGIWITIEGQDFRQEAEVFFGGVKAPETRFIDQHTVTVRLPAHPPGEVQVILVNYDGGITAPFPFEYLLPGSKPRIDQVMPNRGPHLGYTEVTITGLDFREGVRVFFGHREALEVELLAYNKIAVISPPGEPGRQDIIVFNPDMGTAVLPGGFTYYQVSEPRIEAIEPQRGPAAGGIEIVLTGAGWEEGARLWIGGAEAAIVEISPESLKAVTPPGEVGWQPVRLVNPDGGWYENPALRFYYEAPRTAPGEPGWLDAWTEDETSIGLAWEETEFASYYEIYIAAHRSGPYSFLDHTTGSRYYASPLNPDQRYYFKVRAVNELGASDYSYGEYARTDDGETPRLTKGAQLITGKDTVTVVVPNRQSLNDLSHRIDLRQRPYKDQARVEIRLGSEVINSGSWFMVLTKEMTLSLAADSVLSGSETGSGVYGQLVLEDLGPRELERAMNEVFPDSVPLSGLYSLTTQKITGDEVKEHQIFAGRIQVSFSHDYPGEASLYYYNLLQGQWRELDAQTTPGSSALSADVFLPGWYLVLGGGK